MFRNDDDRKVYLWALGSACAVHQVDVHAYVLMTNHIHALVTPNTAQSLPKVMQSVGRYYVPYFNKRHGRTGGLFEGRYRASHVESEEYWFNAARYIELNPVRAGLVAAPEDYRWSSYRMHAFGEPDLVASSHACYQRLGSTPIERQRSWQVLCGPGLTEEELQRLRNPAASYCAVPPPASLPNP